MTLPESSPAKDAPAGREGLRSIFMLDGATSYLLLGRAWQFLAGFCTLILITRVMPREVQGYYYSFSSLVGLSAFLELGLYTLTISLASHEWAWLSLDSARVPTGDAQAMMRLSRLVAWASKYYAIAGIAFSLVVGLFGWRLFSAGAGSGNVRWEWPWALVVVLQSANFAKSPKISILEACGQMRATQLLRFWQTVVSNFVFWTVMVWKGGLWAMVSSTLIALLLTVFLVDVKYRPFFQTLSQVPPQAGISWKREVWPLQWKLAMQDGLSSLVFSLFTPIIFNFHGAVAAGRFGLTWQMVSTLQMASSSWLQARRPLFGILVARAELSRLRQEWRRTLAISLGAMGIGGAGFLGGLFIAQNIYPNLADRFLPLWAAALLWAGATLGILIMCNLSYFRAFKVEPTLWVGLGATVLGGVLAYHLGRHEGGEGIAIGYFLVAAAFSTPLNLWIFSRFTGERP